MPDYKRLRFSLPVDLEDELVAELWSLGALGFEVQAADAGRLRVDAYFPSPLPAAIGDHELTSPRRGANETSPRRGAVETPWAGRGVLSSGSEHLADRDWLASYRQSAEPFDIGRKFRVDPGDAWIDPSDPGDPVDATTTAGDSRFILRIPAQTAFGTGSHESTRLVLEWLEELDLAGLDVLDVGTGSGILSFAAERLGAGRIVAFDVDAPAICIARGNARLNALDGVSRTRCFAGSLAALRVERRFDLALVNILPENFTEISGLAGLLRPGGRVISSGNLAGRRDELLARWRRHGFALEAERRQDEWIAFLLVADSAPGFTPWAAHAAPDGAPEPGGRNEIA